MLKADMILAQGAIDDAKLVNVLIPSNKKCYDREIFNAEAHIRMSEGFIKKLPSFAMPYYYQQAWISAQKAMEYAKSNKNIC